MSETIFCTLLVVSSPGTLSLRCTHLLLDRVRGAMESMNIGVQEYRSWSRALVVDSQLRSTPSHAFWMFSTVIEKRKYDGLVPDEMRRMNIPF